MGKSFYTGTDAELYNGSEVFATKIAATPLLYGLTAPDAVSYGTVNGIWRSAYEAILDPATRTTPKIAAKNTAAEQIRAATAFLADRIYGTPSVTDEMKLDLGLSVRDVPSPKPAPGTPEGLKVSLDGNGGLILGWKCNNPPGTTGTIYQVWRQLGGEGDFVFLGSSGKKDFVDSTLPAGSSVVTYKIRALRSTVGGLWATFNVYFGTGGGGMAAMTVVSGPTSPKMAA